MRNRTPVPRGRFALTLLSIVTFAVLAIAGQASAGIDESSPLPSISSDKADYTPGELVTLSGAFWAAGESVHVVVNDDAGQTWRYETDVTAAEDGTFSLQFNLPDHFVAEYRVTATGASSGTATSSFTDANIVVRARAGGSPLAVSFPANFATVFNNLTCATPPAGTPDGNAFTTSGNNNNYTNSGADADQTQSVRVTAPSPVTISGTTYTFSNWTAEANAVLVTGTTDCFKANGNGAWNLTANYVADAAAPTAASISINGGAAWTNSSTGSVTLDLSASDNVGVSRYRLAETQAGLASAADVAVSPAEASFSRSGVSFTLTGAEAASKSVWLRVCDAANNCADASDTIGWDKTAPVIVQHDFSPAANAAGWHKTDITVRFKATDALSGLNAACLTAFPDVGGDRLQSKVINTEGNPVSVDSDSCTDVAGNTAGPKTSQNFKLDKTAPSVTVSLARDPDHNGWYNAPVGYSAAGSDTLSGIDSCQPAALYSGPDGEPVTATRTCTDVAGNVGSGSASFDYDNTDPEVTATPSRSPDHNGWYNAPFSVSYSGEDETSGIDSCDADDEYDGPDTAGDSLSGNCSDNAGNSASASYDFMYDATVPTVSATPSRSPDHNGWYNAPFSVSYSGEDDTSGIDSCDADDDYSGPDTAGDSLSGNCSDNAGNSASASYDFMYDATAPTVVVSLARDPDHNGWYNAPVGYSAAGSDETSGLADCDADGLYNGPDGEDVSASLTCRDNAGNEGEGSVSFDYDNTDPVVTATPNRTPDSNGWYNDAFSVSYSGEDETSGIDSCDADDEYDGPDTAGDSLSGSCTDNAGNSGSASYDFKYDATAPSVTVNLARDPDHNGWYNHGLGYRGVGSDALSGVDSCQPGAVYTAPDSATASVTRTCTDEAGNEGSGSRTFMFDSTDPAVTVNLARDPDHNGWYNAPVGYTAAGSDETSGLDSCQAGAVYSGPDGDPVTVTRTCTDNAGNEGVGSRSFKYDATSPTMVATLSPPANGNGWNKTDVTVSFTCDDNLSGIDPSYGCPADEVLTSQGLHTLHKATSDIAGNLITPSFDVRIDKTNPVISGSASPAANSHGWNNTNVVVSFSCFDGLSGLDFCEPAHTLSSNGAGQSVTGHAKDKADNQASATVNDINIDKLPPNVSVTGVANGATYTQGSVPAAGCSTTDQAGLSGVDTPASVSVSGPASGVGSFTATCSGATDRAGNSASASVTYNVNYNWTGFFQPIDNNPDQSGNPALATVWNSAKAGQAIPVKFSLHGNQGLSIFATGYPKSTKVTCPSASTAPDPIETYASSTSGLHYDAAADQYNYVWKTTTALANTCQRLEVKLVDGTSHYAFFRFVK